MVEGDIAADLIVDRNVSLATYQQMLGVLHA
jgi:hypothetical protein